MRADILGLTDLFGGCKPEYCWAVEGWSDGEDSVEVVVLLQHRHDLQRADHHGHPLLDVVRTHYRLLQIPCELRVKSGGMFTKHYLMAQSPVNMTSLGIGKCHINRLSYHLTIFNKRRSFLATKTVIKRLHRSGFILPGSCNYLWGLILRWGLYL